jgi:TolB-like protein/DNA-binding winged helix-turn-helix (wHTH) protein
MAIPVPRAPRLVRFGVFEADLDAGVLRRRGVRVRLQDKPLRLLELLLERPKTVVTRQEIRDRLWSADTFVDFDHGLDAAMHKLRGALRDPASAPRFIETLPRRGYRFIGETAGSGGAPVPGERVMLAVLPFRNASGDPEQEVFTDGLTREMSIRVGRIAPSRLAVIATSSSLRFRDGTTRLDRVARGLGADFVLDGEVRRANGRIRISAQLVSAADQTSLWGDSFDREIVDEFDVQREVAAHVAGALAIEFLPGANATNSVARRDPHAHDLYLRARYHLNRRTPDSLRKALAAYEETVAREPDWPEAHACVAEALVLGQTYGLYPPLDALPRARGEVLRALVLDPTVPDGHTILAFIRHRHDWDWDEAQGGFERATALDPNCSVASHLHAQLLSHRGRHDEAIAAIRHARRIDPLSRLFRSEESCLLTNARRYPEAAEAARSALEIEESYAVAHHSLFRALHQLGQRKEALEAARRGVASGPDIPYVIGGWGVAAAAAGARDEAVGALARLDGAGGSFYASPAQKARILLALDRKDEALDQLEQAVRERATELPELSVEPEWDPLRPQPRFRRVLREVGLSG